MQEQVRCSPSVASQISTEFGRLEQTVQTLVTVQDQVIDALKPIAREEIPCPSSAAPGAIEEQLVPVADRLRQTRRVVERMIERMGSLSERIEL